MLAFPAVERVPVTTISPLDAVTLSEPEGRRMSVPISTEDPESESDAPSPADVVEAPADFANSKVPVEDME